MEWIAKLTDAEIILELFGIQQHLEYLENHEEAIDDRELEEMGEDLEQLVQELKAREKRSA